MSPSKKVLRQMLALSVTAGAVPLTHTLCDYLLYYPFIDEAELGTPQILDNAQTLPRHTSGEGVQMMAVVTAPHTAAGPTFDVSYTNQAGVSGRTSGRATFGAQTVNGTLLTSAPATAGCIGAFLPLQVGDTGVRSVESVTIQTLGDVGLFTLVLVKPLADVCLRGIDAPSEVDYFRDQGGQMPIDAGSRAKCRPSPAGRPIQRVASTRPNWPCENRITGPSRLRSRAITRSARKPTSAGISPSGQPSRHTSQPGRCMRTSTLRSPS